MLEGVVDLEVQIGQVLPGLGSPEKTFKPGGIRVPVGIKTAERTAPPDRGPERDLHDKDTITLAVLLNCGAQRILYAVRFRSGGYIRGR